MKLDDAVVDRLILGARAGRDVVAPGWFADSHRVFAERLADPRYPCFLGAAAARQGGLYYTFADAATLPLLPEGLSQFLHVTASRTRERCNLAVFFAPDSPALAHADYHRRFWALLDFLHGRDRCPWPADAPRDPEDPSWEFVFAGQQIFCFCAAPSYRRRRSRNLGPGLIVLMQPRLSFFGLEAGSDAGEAARRVTRQRLQAWDGMDVHPDLLAFGEPANREWKQYVLPDDNEPQAGRCPFRS